jgi:murein DD-endopeptidase MepM/ murein hydrolase activator NlpD
MSIFKDTFKQGVQDQITARQNAIVGRSVDSMQYFNSRNAWIKMTSAVNVGGSADLAAKYILQGGILNSKSKLRSGLGQDGAYSNVSPTGKPYRLGIRPMPGINHIEVKSKSAYGSLREITVHFQAWDIRQLEDLELLYMRPGYSVLVEWGWSPYLDNKGALQTTVNYNEVNILGNSAPKTSKEDIWKAIYTKAARDGNYDAVYGFIKNYSWSARTDGGYDCTTTIITMGEILESLKINYGSFDTNVGQIGAFKVLPVSSFQTSPNNALLLSAGVAGAGLNGSTGAASAIVSVINESNLSKSYAQNLLAGILNELYLIMKDSSLSKYAIANNFNEGTFTDTTSGYSYTFFRYDLDISGNNKLDKTDFHNNTQIFIKLKDFINLLNTKILLHDSDHTNPKALVEVSVTEGTIHQTGADLLCLSHPFQLSTDPSVCLIKNNKWIDPQNNFNITVDNVNLSQVMNGLKSDFYKDTANGSAQLGVIGNIYVNLGYLYSLVTNEDLASRDKKEKNDISVFDFLKNMLNGINTAIGNVANLDIFVDPVDSVARIIDVNYVDSAKRQKAYDDAFIIQMQNIKSVVRSYKLESQIFPEQSTIVAIGAQVKGGALGTDVNTLIDFNQNLEDRIIPKRDAPLTTIKSNPLEEAETKVKNLKTNLNSITKYISKLEPGFWSNTGDFSVLEASKYANSLKDIISFYKDLTPDDNKNRAIIPTKLSIDMDGVGGIIIGNLFRIPDDILPRGYKGDGAGPKKISYVVTGIGHSIQNNDWTTHLDAQFIILDEPTGSISIADANKLAASIIGSVSNGNTIQAAATLAGLTSTPNGLVYPVKGLFTISSKFGTVRADEIHPGTDISVGLGTPVIAVEDGTVIASTFNTLNGNYIRIQHTGQLAGYDTIYLHMSQLNVNKGDKITKGQIIGLSGNTGKLRGPHLHFQIDQTGGTTGINPSQFFPGF